MSEVEELLNLIKDCWPRFQVSKESLLRPTQELVVRFYSHFISDYNDKIAYLTGTPVSNDFNTAELESEEWLFLQLSKLLGKIHRLKFTIADIYQPTPMRTKNFFKICVHFIAFTENYLLNETDVLGTEVFKTKEDTTKLLIEQQELLSEINENAKCKAELAEEHENFLKQEYKIRKNSYKELNDFKAAKEKEYAEKKNQIERLKCEMQNEEYDLKRLEKIEKELLEKKITEPEYQNILRTVETLKNELETLDCNDVNIEDGLVHEKEVLRHGADCLRVLSKFDFNLQNVKKLIQQEEELKVVFNSIAKMQENTLNPKKVETLDSKRKVAELKDQLLTLQSEYKSVKDIYTESMVGFSQDITRIKRDIGEASQINSKVILDYEQDIAKLEEDMTRLKKTFTTEYIRVSKVENRVMEKFHETLKKYADL